MIGHPLLQNVTANTRFLNDLNPVYLIGANAQVTEYRDRKMKCQASREVLEDVVSAVHLTRIDACSSVAVIQDMPVIFPLAHTTENKLSQFLSSKGDRFRF
jgi:hypothetical protein